MLEFNVAPQFSHAYDRFPEIGSIVSSPQACLLMRETAFLGHPAVDALHHLPDLCRLINYVDRYDSEWSNAVRRLIGHLCSQVMEHLDYEEVQANADTVLSTIFQRGAVYSEREYNE